jgi:methyltransferase, FkbM family
MFEKLYLKLLMNFVYFVDYTNKKKILNYFKSKLKDVFLVAIDVGTHKGETIDFFLDNFNIKQIFCCEPNTEVFSELNNKKKYQDEKIKLFNLGLGQLNEEKQLSILRDSSSSTLNPFNENSKYFKRKKKILNYFSYSDEYISKKELVKILKTSDFINQNQIKDIDVLKIDTEGYEYKILKGINNDQFKFIKFIYFEHHYDLMLNKGYKFRDINDFLG